MKKIFSWFVFVAVAAQIIWLGWNYHARSVEIATSPRILIAARTDDPRDLTRGYYQALDGNISLSAVQSSALLGSSVDQSRLQQKLMESYELDKDTSGFPENFTPPTRHSATAQEIPTDRWESFPLSTFWVKQDSGLWVINRLELPESPEDTAQAGEIRIPMSATWNRNFKYREEDKVDTSIFLELSFPGMRSLRYYYPEDSGDFFSLVRRLPDTEGKLVDISVELCIRPTASIMPTQLYLNGIPYNEATELLKQNKFPFRKEVKP